MNRKLGVGVLIVCFSMSNVNWGFASEVVAVAPIIVQPYSMQDVNQQNLAQDRVNRDEEIEIQNLIAENKQLIRDVLATRQDQGLARVDASMSNYADALYSRDQARILANSQQVSPRYASLVALTEDADAMTQDRGDLENKNALLAQKYQMLSQLKDEMVALNEKLKAQDAAALEGKDKVIGAYKDLVTDQQSKIQLLVARLNEMDAKISHYDAIIAEKDQEIALLKSNLTDVTVLKSQIEEQVDTLKAKDQMLKEQSDQIAFLQKQGLQNVPSSSSNVSLPAPIVNVQNTDNAGMDQIIAQKDQVIKSQADQLGQYAQLQDQISGLRARLHQEDADLQAKNDSLRWLNQVLATAKTKAEYYRLGSQKDRESLMNVQNEIVTIKDDFARQLKNYDQVNDTIVDLRGQVSRLNLQLTDKQNQVDLLKTELENRISQENDQAQQEQDLKARLQDKEDQINKLKGQIQTIQADQVNKERILQHATAEAQDRIKLAKQLIDLQQQEAQLLDEKNSLVSSEGSSFEQRAHDLQDRIQGVIATHHYHMTELRNHMEQLKNELGQKEGQVDSLNASLQDKISQLKNQTALDYEITDLKNQVQQLTDQLQDREVTIDILKKQVLSGQETQAQLLAVKNKLADQEDNAAVLKQELDNKIGALNRATLAMVDYKSETERSQNQLEAQIADLQSQLQDKQTAVADLKAQLASQVQSDQATSGAVEALKQQLAYQENKLNLLAAQLRDKIEMEKKQNVLQGQIEELKAQLQLRETVIANLKAQLSAQAQSGQETSGQVDVLKQELADQENKMTSLESVLRDKIEQEKNEKVLEYQIQDLKVQLQDKDNQIADLKAQLQTGQASEAQVDSLKQQLSDAENKEFLLKQELGSKGAQSDQMELMIADYQKKLEAKDGAYNDELRQVLAAKNDQTQMEAQIAGLNARLQDKEAEIVKIKKDMYDLQQRTSASDQDIQAKDLSIAMAQQKLTDEKIKAFEEKINGLQAADQAQIQVIADLKAELALARQQMKGMPSSDEIEYLKAGIKKATAQLQEKDAQLAQIQANADEYTKEFKAQSDEFKSVKAQLQDALDDVGRKKEDLKYKDMEITRLKVIAASRQADLQDQVGVLSWKLEAANKKLQARGVLTTTVVQASPVIVAQGDNKTAVLQAQLDSANLQIKSLQSQLSQLQGASDDRLREKLQQALVKIDQQGQYINQLVQKLHDVGQAGSITAVTPHD